MKENIRENLEEAKKGTNNCFLSRKETCERDCPLNNISQIFDYMEGKNLPQKASEILDLNPDIGAEDCQNFPKLKI